jgi:kumamolisin
MVPDLAFYADPVPGWAIYCTATACDNRGWLAVGGTSAATPLFASGIALANQEAATAGQPPVGFPNPLLYQLARTKTTPFRDIVLGTNDLFSTGCCHAHKGYDRASGWGSMDIADFSRQAGLAYRTRGR